MALTLLEDPENEKYNKVCKNGYPEGEYQGNNHCMYNMARALAESVEFLKREVSPNPKDWEWKNLHVNEYSHMPFSQTKLKPLYHREVPIGGSYYTVKCSKYSFKKFQMQKTFKSNHSPNYKQVIQFAESPEDQVMLFSFDGGQSGNLLAGHYFDMN
jgi:acyl-homoserine lactone acylase PvdQ